jgi:ribosome biogenesis GTPase / thiamine phosphate phosphatase
MGESPDPKKKIRADFKKKHQGRVRRGDLTRSFHRDDPTDLDDAVQGERVSGKGELTRRRTIVGDHQTDADNTGIDVQLAAIDGLLVGRVLSVHGLRSRVQLEDGRVFACAVRRLLKNLATDQRHVVVAGDRVYVRLEGADDGMIERVEPRVRILSRTSRGRRHVIAANVDQLLIVTSAAEPAIKPNLIDRMLLTAQQCQLPTTIVINKADLVDVAKLVPLMGVYSQLGYRVLLTSCATGQGIDHLRALVRQRRSAVAGQSGVGKSSILNAIEPQLSLRVGEVSQSNEKGKHTTTAAVLVPLTDGGHLVDTPGIRQFQLWDITAAEVSGLMPDFRPYESSCRFPDCRHLNETACAVKSAVADGRIDPRRYDAYCHLLEEELLTSGGRANTVQEE